MTICSFCKALNLGHLNEVNLKYFSRIDTMQWFPNRLDVSK